MNLEGSLLNDNNDLYVQSSQEFSLTMQIEALLWPICTSKLITNGYASLFSN